MYSNLQSIGSFFSSTDSLTSHADALLNAVKPLSLFQSILDCLGDGILIVTDQGEIIHANSYAQQLCRQMGTCSAKSLLHPAIWQVCQSLIRAQKTARHRAEILDEELRVNESLIRVRVRPLHLEEFARPCLLVTLEDQYASARCRAIAEATKYGLTSRETEVWLLKRIGCTYKQIAAQLHIAEDTVKKHIKNIYARREAIECTSG